LALPGRDLIEVEVRPVSPFRLPRWNGSDRIVRRHGNGLRRLLVVDQAPVVVAARPAAGGTYRFSAIPVEPERLTGPGREGLALADENRVAAAIDQFRFSLGIDVDMGPFHDAFIDDPLLGPAIRRRIHTRSPRRADSWEALAWAVTEQLIEYRRAAAIQRRMIRRWGLSLKLPASASCVDGYLSTAPSPEAIAGASPAELQSCDLSAGRSLALIRCAKEIACGRVDPGSSVGDRRLLAIPGIGPWTIACLALRGRGEPDALLAGDLGHIKLVGALAGLGRPAEVEEVESFYARYEPFRGIAGDFLLAHRGAEVSGPGNRARIRASVWHRPRAA
jgi:3-methyladenine DNA glycosylase/8-oxoguanine DNA glycosylase